MRWKTTWMTLGLAAALFAFIMLVERRIPDGQAPPIQLFDFKASEVTNIQLRLTNQLVLRVQRAKADAPWFLTVPISYPAQPYAIESLIQSLEKAVPQAEISPQELRANKRTVAEFGLDIPRATLTLQHNGQRTEILYGAPTPVGRGVYLQVVNQPGIYVLNADLAARLPRSHNDWRDTRLIPGVFMNRIEVRAGGHGFTVEVLDATNRTFVLTKPTPARADPAKIDAFLRKLLTAEIKKFVTDNPRADLEPYGLQPPEAELAFLVGTNDQFVVQFGKSPADDPSAVYARRLSQTNIVLVPRSVLETVQISHSDLRDLHLVSFLPSTVEAIEVLDTDNFAVRRQTNGAWMITEPEMAIADTNAVNDWLDALARLEGAVEKDVVTDFANPYGLSDPARRYLLKGTVTNASGFATNRVLAELDLGKSQEEKVFARRPDEATVYSLARKDVAKLPRAAWQLLDRKVWSFTTNQVRRVTIRYHGRLRTLERKSNASWSLVEGEGVVPSNNAALEETMHRLGELRAAIWVAKGETSRALFGFTDTSNRVTIELATSDKSQVLVLEFGGPSPTQLPYALAVVDGQTSIFEFPPTLYFEVDRDLFKPMFRMSLSP